jgi:Flp pilus assembly protein TadG
MRARRSYLCDERATAAAEMALVLPMLLVLLFGGLEAGHYFWSEHKAIEAVRNGARYASRLPVTTVCPTSGTAAAAISDVALMTRTGQLASSTATPVVPGWSNNNQVTVTFNCGGFVSTGIYASYGSAAPTVQVSTTNLTYPSLFEALGVITSSATLNASASTAVIGI